MNNKWERLRGPLLIFSISLNIAFIAFWMVRTIGERLEHPPKAAAPGGMYTVSDIHRELGLNDEQMKKLEKNYLRFQAEAMKAQDEIGDLRLQLMGLLSAPEVNETAVRAKQSEILAAQKKIQGLVIDHVLAEREVLTPSQRERYFKMICSQCAHSGNRFPGIGGRGRLSPNQRNE